MTSFDNVQKFADDPIGFFDHCAASTCNIAPEELEPLQLAAARYRFEGIRNTVPMLMKLADNQGINTIGKLNDLVPLLFEHTMYKSYPASILERSRFTQLTQWFNKLTAEDLSEIDVSSCVGIDDWLACLEQNSNLRPIHSSGTTGTMSFLPTHKDELDVRTLQTTAVVRERCPGLSHAGTADDPLNMHVVFPYFRQGGKAYLRLNDGLAKFVAGDEARFHAAFPGRVSSDMDYLAARIRSAQASGKLDRLEISPTLLERKKEFDDLQRQMPGRLDQFFADVVANLKGQDIFTTGTWNLVYNMADAGLKQGVRGVFSANSFVLSGGGAKGMTPPEGWKEKVAEFIGVKEIQMAYGMSEMTGTAFMCSQGNYHIPPWWILYVLDPDTSAPLQREGTVTGRAAFFDLVPTTHWGGFISGDEITLNWDGGCACGRSNAYILDTIERYSDKRGGDDKISCAATAEAHQDAMNFLNSL